MCVKNFSDITILAEPIFLPEFLIRLQLSRIAVSHHERYDGGGYPEGLLAGEIPFLARVCAVADTFDGITSWKPYKTKQTDRNKAKEIILSESGKQFDPFIAKTFAEVIPFLPEI